jgi:hypothetical protein
MWTLSKKERHVMQIHDVLAIDEDSRMAIAISATYFRSVLQYLETTFDSF